MKETRVWSLGREDTLEKGMANHSCSCLENTMDGGAWWATGMDRKESNVTEWQSTLWIYSDLLIKYVHTHVCMCFGFPDNSVGKESTCNAGDPGLIPGSGRSAGEGKGCPLQYSWASLVAQLVKNLPAMQETWVRSLGWQDLLQKGKPTHSSILAWRIPWIVQSMGSQRVKQDWATFTFMHVFQIEQCLTLKGRLAETFVLND